ncbi:MAG: hypothetical protein IJF52_04095 [Clostridia bacterium]|nr:hypothetical protein [Clostridia bacterium]
MKIKNLLTVLLSGLFVLSLSLWCFFGKTPDYSESERRVLESFPKVTFDTISSGEFSQDFEKYSTDRFPLRDTFRSLKAYTRLYAFSQKDNNGLFVAEGHLSKLQYPENPVMTQHATELFTKIKETYLADNKIYLTIIPDKNMFIARQNGYLSLDYKAFSEYFKTEMPYAEYIEISDFLNADDYYLTDTHWRQEKITDVAKHLAESMGQTLNDTYTENTLRYPFNGVYVGQSALKVKSDTIIYLTNDTIDSLEVEGAKAVYDMSKAQSKDPYEMFLSGTQPVVKVKNPQNAEGKRLVVFRDSFASSITPLLSKAYSEITLVDLRYINSSILDQYVDFSNSDVLFMYSTMLLNDSLSMK